MNMHNVVAVTGAILLISEGVAAVDLTSEEQLGKSIFFDHALSINENQSCAACHDPSAGWTGPVDEINVAGAVYEGSIPGRFGNRKPPSSAYATLSPIFHLDKSGLFVGGNFWDGRATGEKLGNPAADQAQGPFINPVEQALPDSACVVYRVCDSSNGYPTSFEDVWGTEACDISWPGDTAATCATERAAVALSDADRSKSDMVYDQIALSIAAYEDSPEVNAFTSKYDQTFGGKVKLSKLERQGFALFRGKGRCALCHTANGQEALFTDFTFDNLGLPRNPENPAVIMSGFVDPGLGGFLESAGYDAAIYEPGVGRHKVPTLRNVGKGSCEAEPTNPTCITKAFGHNGYFKSLATIVHFYNTRDIKPSCESLGVMNATEADALENDCWPLPEVPANVNTEELGDLGLSSEEEAAIVAFLIALSDGYGTAVP
jgi:cytochrome c peroxidase